MLMAHSSNFSSREKYHPEPSEDDTYKQQRVEPNIQQANPNNSGNSGLLMGQYSGTMMLMVHKNESLDHLKSNQTTDEEQDEMLLTRTDVGGGSS